MERSQTRMHGSSRPRSKRGCAHFAARADRRRGGCADIIENIFLEARCAIAPRCSRALGRATLVVGLAQCANLCGAPLSTVGYSQRRPIEQARRGMMGGYGLRSVVPAERRSDAVGIHRGARPNRERDMTVASSDEPTKPLSEPVPTIERRGPTQLQPGTKLGRFRIIDMLGKGGMGAVYRADDEELGRHVALKVLVTGFDDGEMAVEARLMREAQALAKLNHPNVIAIYDVAHDNGVAFVAMELVDGPNLNQWLKAERRSRGEIVSVFLQAGRGLSAAHAAGLVHRDFKPDNVIIGSDGRVRVLDFGLARAAMTSASHDQATSPADASMSVAMDEVTPPSFEGRDNLLASPLTRAGILIGTPTFMSPEQHEGGIVDAASDQFSFCTALYRALYGETPFKGGNLAEYRKNVLAGRVRPAPANSNVPPWLRQVLLRGLAVARAERFPSMDALLAALADDPAPRRRRGVLAGAALLVLVAAGFALRATRRVESTPPPCASAGTPITQVWNDRRRAELSVQFAASGQPHADLALTGVTRALDDSAAAWAHMSQQSCEATRVQHVQSEELLDLRTQCLARRQQELEASVDLFAHADPATVKRLLMKPPESLSVAECADGETLKSAQRLPGDPATQARLDEAQRVLAHARALRSASDYEGALALLDAKVAEVRQIGHRPLLAELMLLRSAINDVLARNEAARQDLEEAVVAAMAGRRDDLVVEGWTALFQSLAGDERKFDEAAHWARLAEAALDRLDRPDLLTARVLAAESLMYFWEDRYDDAQERATKALAIWSRGDQNARGVASVSRTLGMIAYGRGRRSEALEHFTRALTTLERVTGPDHPELASILNGRANTLLALGRLDEASADYERALAISETRLGAEHPRVIVCLTNIASLRRQQGHVAEARALFEKVLAADQARHPDHADVAVDLEQLASTAVAENKPDEALALVEQAEHAPGAKGAGASLQNELHMDRGQALALLGRHRRRSPSSPRRARAWWRSWARTPTRSCTR